MVVPEASEVGNCHQDCQRFFFSRSVSPNYKRAFIFIFYTCLFKLTLSAALAVHPDLVISNQRALFSILPYVTELRTPKSALTAEHAQ